MSLFKDSLNYLNTNKRKIVGYTITIISFLIISHGLSFAGNTGSPANGDSSSVGTMVVSTVNAIMRMAGAVLGALTFLVGLFLYPGWTSGSVIGLGDPLKTMWIMVSNIVYFIFAFIFIWIAFMNIIGKEDNYQLKQAIPRFIVGVLIVPFSWFFVQFIISLSSILTVGVLSLPYDTFKGTDFFSDSKLEVIELCSENIINIGSGSGANNLACKNGAKKLSLKDMVSAKDSESLYGLAAFYTYGVMKVDTSGILYKTDIKSGVKNIFDLGLKMVLDIIFIIVYMLLMIALALALFVRGVMLWMFAMFSPVFGLLYFFKKGGDGAGKGASKHFNIKEFVKLALVPVYVAGALAFGLVFLFVAGTGFTKYSDTQIKGGKSIISADGSTVTLGQMSFTLEGARADSSASKAKDEALGFKGSFGTMLLQLFGIGILWMAVMAALKSSDITESAVEPIADFGKSIGDLIKKSPGYMPIIPTPGGPISAAGLGRAGSTFTGTIDQHFSQKGTEMGTNAARLFGADDNNTVSKLSRVIGETNSNLLQTNNGINEFVRKLTEGAGDIDKFVTDKHAKEKYVEGLKLAGVGNETLLNSIKQASSPRMLANELSKIINDSQTKPLLAQELRNMGWTNSDNILAKFSGGSGGNQQNTPQINSIPNVTHNANTIKIAPLNTTAVAPISITKDTSGKLTTGLDKIVNGFKNGGYDKQHTEAEFRKTLKDTLGLHDDDVNSVINQLGSGFFK